MRNFGHIAAVRIYLDRAYDSNDGLGESKVKVRNPVEPWHVAILEEAYQLYPYVIDRVQEVIQCYRDNLEARAKSDGRVIQPAFPVQLSGGLTQIASIIERSELKLDRFYTNIEEYDDRCSFGTNSSYEEFARSELKTSRDLIKRARLFLHTYLWILWTQESLFQANRFGGLLENQDFFPENSENSFSYIAHPPLVVATLGCTAMIEEVGALYLNKLTSQSIPPDGTSCSRVLQKMRKSHLDTDEFDLDLIEDFVVDTRNDISHYITRRTNLITLDEFEEYCIAVLEGIELVRNLLIRLLDDLLDVDSQISSEY